MNAPPWPKPPASDLSAGPGETLDRLAGDWWIFQSARGHRYSTDDVVLAWCAMRAAPEARRVLDLGAGVGSVGLMTLLCLGPATRLTAIEIQPTRAALLRKTVQYNGLGEHVRVIEGDLRLPIIDGAHDLVVANPPYLAPDTATMSRNPERAAARLELHGNIYDYARAAARVLTDEGRFVCCHVAGDARASDAIARAGLHVNETRRVRFRAGRSQVLSVYVASRQGLEPHVHEPRAHDEILVRDGELRTDVFRAMRRALWIE